MRLLLLLGLAALALAAPARPKLSSRNRFLTRNTAQKTYQLQSPDYPLNLTPTELDHDYSLPLFDPNLGTLISVLINVHWAAQLNITVLNNNTFSVSNIMAELEVTATDTLVEPALQYVTIPGTTMSVVSSNLDVYPGRDAGSVTPQATTNTVTEYHDVSAGPVTTGLSNWLGSSAYPTDAQGYPTDPSDYFLIHGASTSKFSLQTTNPANVQFVQSGKIGETITVTYTYDFTPVLGSE